MNKRILLVLTLVYLFPLRGFSLEGIYQLELEDINKKVISRATGFYIKTDFSNTAYILTSFHFLNARLLEAEKIRVEGKNSYLEIIAYDELNDILVLSAKDIDEEPFSFGDNCKKSLKVAGYHKENFLVVDAGESYKTKLRGINRLPVYLSKGFSGAPVLNNDAQICGMVVLSSEMNASSIAVSHKLLKEMMYLRVRDQKLYTIRDVRRELGVEITVRNQKELDTLISKVLPARQIVLNLDPEYSNTQFILKNARNIVLESQRDIDKLVIHGSKNIMVKGIEMDNLIINESEDVTVTACRVGKTSLTDNNGFEFVNTRVIEEL